MRLSGLIALVVVLLALCADAAKQSYYDTLGVSTAATQQDIKRAYR